MDNANTWAKVEFTFGRDLAAPFSWALVITKKDGTKVSHPLTNIVPEEITSAPKRGRKPARSEKQPE